MSQRQRNKKKTAFLVQQPNGRYALYDLKHHHFIDSNIIMLDAAKAKMTKVFGIVNPELATSLKAKTNQGEMALDFWVVCMEDMKAHFRSGLLIRSTPIEGIALYEETMKNHTRGLIG